MNERILCHISFIKVKQLMSFQSHIWKSSMLSILNTFSIQNTVITALMSVFLTKDFPDLPELSTV